MKGKLMDQIRQCATEYSHVYVFRVRNMRNVFFKNLRTSTEGRYFIGKNKVMALALGQTESSECVAGASLVARMLKGDRGLLFTNDDPEKITSILDSVEETDFARTGNKADLTVVIENDPKGLRNVATGELLSATLEPQLRQAGMPTKLQGGIILLSTDTFTVCEEGKALTAAQARILKAFGIKMASFKVALVGHLFDGTFEEYEDPFAQDESTMMEVAEGEEMAEEEDGDEEVNE